MEHAKHAELGARIRSRRSELGLSADDFADRADLSVQHAYRIERGLVRPRRRKLAHIANVLGVRIEWLLTGEGRKLLNPGELAE